MNAHLGRIRNIAVRQHKCVATWQMRDMGMSRSEITSVVRGLLQVHHGVYALAEPDETGWFMAAALALGRRAAISHDSALYLLGLRPFRAGDIDVSVPSRGGRAERDGIQIHRRRNDFGVTRRRGIPVTDPTTSLCDAELRRHELYRALEEADRRGLRIDRDRLRGDVSAVQRAVVGRTRSDTEAAFVLLCHDDGLKLPRVNHQLNGIEADFHWRAAGLVVEVDGFEHHRERDQFNEDRRRGLVHRAAGFEVVRVSADHVYDKPGLVLRALRRAAPAIVAAPLQTRPAAA
jgi:very-short-patch-repair endonuclease